MRQALDLDVLGLVSDSLLDTATVLSFSLVSRALHPVAVKRLLSMKPIILKDEHSVRTFHAFIFADPEPRLPFVRALNIDIPKLPGIAPSRREAASCVLEILERVTHLESLVLPFPRWTCLNDTRILQAIMRLSTLRELGLLEGCPEISEIVKSTCSASSLRVLRVSLDTLPTSGDDFGLKMAEIDAFLHHLIPTLEVLDIRETTLVLDAKGAEYPALRSLVACIEEGIIRTDILVSKFPALDGTLGVGSVYGALQSDELEQRRIRASNQDSQKKRRWKHLDCVMGDVLALFVLGLTCPVRYLMVHGFCGHQRSEMVDILRATPPTHLKLSTILYHGGDVFQDLFPSEVIPRLTHLTWVLEYANPPADDELSDGDFVQNMQWSTFLTKVIASICALRLTHFRLFVHYDICLNDAEYVPHSRDFVRSMANLDHAHLATELMHAVPSLRHVFLSMGGQFDVTPDDPDARRQTRGRWFAHSAWKNVPSGPPVRLDADVMERMLVDEDLVLSDDDNFSLGFQRTWKEEETAPWPLPE